MIIKVDNELLSLVVKISEHNHSEGEWLEYESSDMFQTKNFMGGFDGDDVCFACCKCGTEKNEFWFEFKLTDVPKILSREIVEFESVETSVLAADG